MERKDLLSKHWIFFGFLLFVLVYRLYYFDFFIVPNTDFFAFRARALEWVSFSWPESFKRAPLFPFVIGWLSVLFPNRYPILFAAQALSLFLYIISLLLIYNISSKFLKKGGFFVPWLFALNPLVYLSNQPILEVFYLTLILLTIYLSLRGSRLAYLAASLSSITRYEAILLIPGLLIRDFIFGEKKSKSLILASLSSIPIGVWLFLSTMHSPFINPYISELLKIGLDMEMTFLRTALRCLSGFIEEVPLLVILGLIFCMVGLWYIIKNSFKEAFLLLLFTFGYMSIHIFYPFNFERFVFPILWVLQLLVVKGVESSVLLLTKRFSFSSGLLWQLFYPVLIILIAGIGIYIFRESTPLLLTYIGFFLFLLFNVVSIRELRKGAFSVVVVFFLSFFVVENINATARLQEWIKYRQAHWKRIGEWYNSNAKEGDKMVLTLPSHVQFYTSLSHDYFVPLNSFKADSFDEFVTELRERRITYVVWDSTYGHSPNDPYGFKSHLVFKLRDGRKRKGLKPIVFINASPHWISPPQYAIIYKVIPYEKRL